MSVIADVQLARAIIETVGECYQREVINILGSATWDQETGDKEKARQIVSYMEHEYALNTANILYADEFDKIPGWLKEWAHRESADNV